MSIEIAIGTSGNTDGVGIAKYIESLSREFDTAAEAHDFLLPYKDEMYADDWATITEVLMEGCATGETVDPELEIRNKDGSYTALCISIRGQQDPDWYLLRDELKRAMTDLTNNGKYEESLNRKAFLELLNGAYAVANAITYHEDRNRERRQRFGA